MSARKRQAGSAGASAAGPVQRGFVRFYHGGATYGGGRRWLTPDLAYAEAYARKTPAALVHYVDLPEDHPALENAFDDSGTTMRAPYVAFDAQEEIARHLRAFSRESGTGAIVLTANGAAATRDGAAVRPRDLEVDTGGWDR